MGFVDVDALLASFSAGQLAEWQAYSQLEPCGEPAANLRVARLMCQTANLWRPEKQEPYQVADFMPDFCPPTEKPAAPDSRELLRKGLAINALFGGLDLRSVNGTD